jgi:hypothetical protein
MLTGLSTLPPPAFATLQHELGQLVLKRFLLLVLLLDKAATHLTAAFRTPLLFKLTSSIKSSKQVCVLHRRRMSRTLCDLWLWVSTATRLC